MLKPNSLIISSSTYDRTRGAVGSLTVGSKLSGSAKATAAAIADNNYVHVWDNSAVDSSFGVTSPIQLTVIEPHSGHVLKMLSVPADQVATSFPSKSELGLHITRDSNGVHLVFMAYAGPGIGALDVSNSDAVAGQDPTNPVTFAFGSTYAFARTIVSMDGQGHFSYTPTINYGGNNGRSALLGSNGLYYTVGNANNGAVASFGPNGTNPDVTETTGLEVVNPINALMSSAAIPANNSAEVDPLIQYQFGTNKPDKPGKDNNYRGVTEFGGALYFTKGSGGNGIQTVYTKTAESPRTTRRQSDIMARGQAGVVGEARYHSASLALSALARLMSSLVWNAIKVLSDWAKAMVAGCTGSARRTHLGEEVAPPALMLPLVPAPQPRRYCGCPHCPLP